MSRLDIKVTRNGKFTIKVKGGPTVEVQTEVLPEDTVDGGAQVDQGTLNLANRTTQSSLKTSPNPATASKPTSKFTSQVGWRGSAKQAAKRSGSGDLGNRASAPFEPALVEGRIEIEEEDEEKMGFTRSFEESGNYDEEASQMVCPEPLSQSRRSSGADRK